MDTKSTKFKYTGTAKAICLVLSVLLFSLGTWCAVELGVGSWVFGTRNYFAASAGEGTPDFTATQAFENVFTSDMSDLAFLSEKNEKAYAASLAKAQEETVESAVKQYMSRQEYLLQQGEDPEEEYFERDPVVHLDSGEECEVALTYDHMALPEGSIREELNRQYDEWETSQLETYVSDFRNTEQWVSENASLRFYVKSVDGTVYTNLPSRPSLNELKKHAVYGVQTAKQDILEGVGFLEDSPEYSLSGTSKKSAIYFCLDDDLLRSEQIPSNGNLYRTIFEDGDDYIATKQLFDAMKDRPAGWILAVMMVSYLLGLAMLLWFLHLTGHVNGDPQAYAEDGSPEPVRFAKDGSRLTYAAVDRLPGDLHFLLSGALFGVCLGLPLAFLSESFHNYSLLRWYPLLGALVTLVCGLILAEWLASVCRTVKSGHGFWKHTLIGKSIDWLGHNGKYIAKNWKDAAANVKYAPKQLPKRAVFWVIGYMLVNMFLINMMAHTVGIGGLLFLILLVAFNIYVLNRLVRYLRGLDEIIEASGTDSDVKLNESGLPSSLKTLAGNLTVTRETMDKAVEKAVREERTRTELITNVTHDLKTPLTSLINYSDLLERKAQLQELGDEESVKYVGVIHDQSEKLKHLIEDLLEAAKASSGNVQLNCTTLNLTELTAQAIAEFSPEMEKNGNEIIFTEEDGSAVSREHLVYADGQKTYRVLANLLSNAQKYAAPNTRIYATLSDGPAAKDGASATTVFELKNTSAAPLNITAEELMARFVRGDRSRGETEGYGLGLSIAKDLTALMGGSLELDIDGDLFKTTVTLPKQEA